MRLSKLFIRNIAVGLTALFISQFALAQPTAAQLEQFKQLPRAQQEALAKQYGVDISQLSGSTGSEQLQAGPSAKLEQRSPVIESVSSAKPAGISRFGANLFDANISTFAPVTNVPVPDSYQLGPDDTLLVQVYGKQNNKYELVVDRHGNVNLPDIGPLSVSGLTVAEASSLIQDRITQANIGLQAAISMGQLRTINIFVAGEARNPGMYAVSALTSVTQALYVSGGVTEIGSLRDIRITRAGKIVSSFDLYDLLLQGNNANDVTLQHGDVLFVASIGALATIEGAVRRPAIYELTANDNIGSLLKMAGGLTPEAQLKNVVIERATAAGRELVNINLADNSANSKNLLSGDRLVIPQLSARIHQQVTVVGAVERPGTYAWRQGLRLTDIIADKWTDLLQSTDMDYALLVRRVNERGDIKVIQFNLLDAVSIGRTQLTLQPQDIVVIFHQVNQGYQRESLNNVIRDNVNNQLARFDANALLAGDVLATNFAIIQQKNAVVGGSQFASKTASGSAPEELQNFISTMLQQLYVEPQYISLSKHLNRRELLFPLMQMLRSQSNNQQELPIVSISGDVKVPGEYPLVEQSTVSKLIRAAGGLNSSAYLQRAELSRFIAQDLQQNAIEQQNKDVNIAQVLADATTDVALASRDRLNIFTTPDWSQIRMVNVQGEVRFPGTYQVLKGEKLSDVIERAGGLTSSAYPFGAVFTRENIRQRESEQAAKLLSQLKADLASRALTAPAVLTAPASGSAELIAQLQTIEPVGRMVVDLDQIIVGNPQYDLDLENQDSLYIPRIQNSVTVMGEVQNPGSHRYRAGLSVKDYLSLAGGARKRADEDLVFVIRADGSVMLPSSEWFAANDSSLKPGDTIIMPLDTEYKDSLSLWTQVTQILFQSAVAISAISSI